MVVNVPTCSISKHSLLATKKSPLAHIELCWKMRWDWAGPSKTNTSPVKNIWVSFPEDQSIPKLYLGKTLFGCVELFAAVCLHLCRNAPSSDFSFITRQLVKVWLLTIQPYTVWQSSTFMPQTSLFSQVPAFFASKIFSRYSGIICSISCLQVHGFLSTELENQEWFLKCLLTFAELQL